MKTIVFANQKGGTGKTAVAVQFSHYLAKMGKRVLCIDMDHQGNMTKAMASYPAVTVSAVSSSQLLTGYVKGADVAASSFVLIGSDREQLLKLERQGEKKHEEFAGNLDEFIKSTQQHFDYCAIDTNPTPDIRVISSLVVADFVLSPIQLNQEAIDGIGALLTLINKIKAINKKLHFLGILPNLVEGTPFQKDNYKQVVTSYSKLLILSDAAQQRYAHIPTRSAFAEAQAAGVPVWEIKKTAARDAWVALEPFFLTILNNMEKK